MLEQRYRRQKENLLKNTSVNPKNREAMKKFLELKEYILKRKEGLSEVDERSYKTLIGFVSRLKDINKWFDNKSWENLTKEEIKKFIDDLEDGVVKTKYGTRYADRSLYYQMMRGKLFKLVNKNQIVIDILDEFEIKGRKDKNEVRFFDENTFKNLIQSSNNITHLALMWLAWDVGENIGTLLSLTKEDMRENINEDTKEPEFIITLPKEKLKRSRTPRTLTTNYPETYKYLKLLLSNLSETKKHYYTKEGKTKKLSDLHPINKLFKFQIEAATKFLKKYVKTSNSKCIRGEEISWKDFRSSMACDLLTKEWTTDEVKARLGHKPSSRMIDKYVDYLALDGRKKQATTKVYQSNIKKLEAELQEQKETNKLQKIRSEKVEVSVEDLNKKFQLLAKLYKFTNIKNFEEILDKNNGSIVIKIGDIEEVTL